MAFKMKNPSVMKMAKQAGSAMKNKGLEKLAAANPELTYTPKKLKKTPMQMKKAAMKLKDEAMKKAAMKLKKEDDAAMKLKKEEPMKMKKAPMKMGHKKK